MASSFTWFAKFGGVFSMLSEDDAKTLAYAIAMYGMEGETVDMPYHVALVFEAMKDDIDHSKSKRSAGSKGGRPRKERPREECSDGDGGDSENWLKPESHEVSTTRENLETSYENSRNPIQNNTEQYRTVQNSTGKGAGRAPRFRPPAIDEVRAYVEEKGYSVDPERFVDFYASKGWKVGSSSMKDWKAAVRSWEHRDAAGKKEEKDATPVFGGW